MNAGCIFSAGPGGAIFYPPDLGDEFLRNGFVGLENFSPKILYG